MKHTVGIWFIQEAELNTIQGLRANRAAANKAVFPPAPPSRTRRKIPQPARAPQRGARSHGTPRRKPRASNAAQPGGNCENARPPDSTMRREEKNREFSGAGALRWPCAKICPWKAWVMSSM